MRLNFFRVMSSFKTDVTTQWWVCINFVLSYFPYFVTTQFLRIWGEICCWCIFLELNYLSNLMWQLNDEFVDVFCNNFLVLALCFACSSQRHLEVMSKGQKFGLRVGKIVAATHLQTLLYAVHKKILCLRESLMNTRYYIFLIVLRFLLYFPAMSWKVTR